MSRRGGEFRTIEEPKIRMAVRNASEQDPLHTEGFSHTQKVFSQCHSAHHDVRRGARLERRPKPSGCGTDGIELCGL